MSRNTITYLVQLAQSSGVEMNAHLVADRRPTRQQSKLKTLSQYIQRHPQGWKKHLELAELLYATGCWDNAVEEYRQVLICQPQLFEVRLKLGKILQLMERETEAVEVYQSALELTENVATRHHLMGAICLSASASRIAICQLNYQQAAKEFQSAASQEPDNAAHWHALGQVYLSLEAPHLALQAFNKVLAIDPDDLIALNHSYDVLIAVGYIYQAQERLSKAIALAPQDFPTLKRLVEMRCDRGLVWGDEGKQTKQQIQALQRLAPQAVDGYNFLAYYHIFRGDRAKGVATLQKFVEEHPKSPIGWYRYARCLFHTEDTQGAAEAILRAYKLYQKDCEIYQALCEILPEFGRLEELKPILEEMCDRFPERWSVWATAGRVLVEHYQEIERGCTVSKKSIQLQPQLADTWFHYGRVLALAGKHLEAVEALEHGWQLLPEARSLPAAVWLGESYQALGDDVNSRKWLEIGCDRAQELMDFNPTIARYWQGRALDRLGNVMDAMQAYQTALNQHILYPAYGEVKEALKRLLTTA
jgi:tetratricopeptide (TPR) repeat protein